MTLPRRLEINIPPAVTAVAEAAVGRDAVMRAVATAVLQADALEHALAAALPLGPQGAAGGVSLPDLFRGELQARVAVVGWWLAGWWLVAVWVYSLGLYNWLPRIQMRAHLTLAAPHPAHLTSPHPPRSNPAPPARRRSSSAARATSRSGASPGSPTRPRGSRSGGRRS